MGYKEKETTEEKHRSDWRDETLYEGREEWSNRCWAWEFLRRNKRYQKLSTTVVGPNPVRRAEAAAEFGRCDLKDYRYSYGAKEDNENHWLSETVMRIKAYNANEKGEHVAYFALQPGEIAMVFTLNHAEKGGRAAVTAQVQYAKKYLMQKLQDARKNSIAIRPATIKKPRRDLWPKLIRLYDAKMHCNAPEDEIIDILYTSKADKGKPLSSLEKIAIRKKISEHFTSAKKMVESGYLSLIPLDYIQDKRQRKVKETTLKDSPI